MGVKLCRSNLGEESRSIFFANRVMRRIFGVMTDGETGEWTKVQNKVLNYLHCSPNIIHVIKIHKNEIGNACSAYGKEGSIRVLLGKHEGKAQLGDPGIEGG